MRLTMRRLWSRLGRREAPVIALAAALAVGTVAGGNGSATPNPVASATRAVAPQLSYLAQATAPVRPADSSVADPSAELADLDHGFVTKWVERFTSSRRHDLETTLDRMDRYTAMISRKLEKRGMPQELVYLALIESGGNPRATSPVKARGLWQFMSGTAKQYGLTVNRRTDERTNPEKATDAALDYLQDLHDRFGSWYLAAAAYNTGQGRVSKVLRQVTGKQKGTDADFYRIASRLPAETRDYVPKLVAVARIAKEPARYGFGEATAASAVPGAAATSAAD
jgi:membrane-bound lytic murein transglycosylase D